MRKKKIIFYCSDIHGYYQEMIEGLNSAGYDENNPNHLLVVLGDIFDRGRESLSVYEYLKRLCDEGKAIVTAGNHHKFLIDYLEGTSLSPFNYMHNGVDETLADFLHETSPFEMWCLFNELGSPTYGDFAKWVEKSRIEINKEYPELLPWLKSLPRYFETNYYIGVHGAIDINAEDWHNPHCCLGNLTDWDALDFDRGDFFGSEIKNTNKTIIIGHFGTRHLRQMYEINDGKDNDSVLVRNDGKIIALDATTCLSHKVNVLVVEDELL